MSGFAFPVACLVITIVLIVLFIVFFIVFCTDILVNWLDLAVLI